MKRSNSLGSGQTASVNDGDEQIEIYDGKEKFLFDDEEYESSYDSDEASGTAAVGGQLYASSIDYAMGMSKLSGSIADERDDYD